MTKISVKNVATTHTTACEKEKHVVLLVTLAMMIKRFCPVYGQENGNGRHWLFPVCSVFSIQVFIKNLIFNSFEAFLD